MKTLQFIARSIINTFFASADPNFFGSRKRQKASSALANEFKEAADDTQNEIDTLKATNPFESAAAKSAMAASSRKAKQIGKKYANMMGGNSTAESNIAAQGATQQAVGATAGAIATGAEANQNSQVANLRSVKANQMSQYGSTQQSSINEIGSGWDSFMGALDTMGGLAEGVGSLATAGVIGAGSSATAA